MILAAAAFADGEGNPPPELELALACERWHCLPSEYLAQDAGLMRRMSIAQNTYTAFREIKKSTNDVEWEKANPELWKIYSATVEMRKEKKPNG